MQRGYTVGLTAGKSSPVRVLWWIALASAIPRLWFGAIEFIEYDGYWHVFIAQQDTWSRFWADVYANAHPPLFFLLLKAVLVFGHSPLVYRSISILSGIVSVYLVGHVAWKITGSNWRAYQCAIAFGFALQAIVISCEVRSYSLSLLFILASFSSLIDVVQRESASARVWFVVWTVLACLSEYFAFFYAGAAMLLLAGRFVVKATRSKWWIEALTLLPVTATIAALYITHAGHLATIQGHLLPYYFDPAGKETIVHFLLRNTANLVNFFLPFRIGNLAIVVALAVIGAPILRSRAPGAQATLIVTAIVFLAIAAAGVADKYPFGGDLRQQFLLFPLCILCVAVAVEHRWGKMGTRANVLLAGIAFVSGFVPFLLEPKKSIDVLQPQMAAFEKLAPDSPAVYVDQYNLITFFIYHHDWKWTAEPKQHVQGIDAYDLYKDGKRIVVFRDMTRWNADPDELPLYSQIAASMKATGTPEAAVFGVRQAPPKPPMSGIRAVRLEVSRDASEAGICAAKMSINPTQWFVAFRESVCPPLDSALRTSGHFDDNDDAIEYVGSWTQAGITGARDGTVSFSKDPGSVARLSFEGTQIEYGYTQAANRGIAEVRIDNVVRGRVDLYGSKTEWQRSQTYAGLGPGKHSFELLVSGDKNPDASDRFVDLDWLEVH